MLKIRKDYRDGINGEQQISNLSGMCLYNPEPGREEVSLLPDGTPRRVPHMQTTFLGRKEHVLFKMQREAENIVCSYPIKRDSFCERYE
jgi:hypothetical protein